MRKEKGYTQNELSEKIHLSRQTISKWETNKSLPDIYTLLLLADIYDTSIQEMLGEEQKVFETKHVLDEEEKEEILLSNTKRRKEEMFTKNAKKFFIATAIWTIILMAMFLTKQIYEDKRVIDLEVTLYGVASTRTETEKELSGLPYEYISELTLTDGTVLKNPTIEDIEDHKLLEKKEGDTVVVYPPQIIDYYNKYPFGE